MLEANGITASYILSMLESFGAILLNHLRGSVVYSKYEPTSLSIPSVLQTPTIAYSTPNVTSYNALEPTFACPMDHCCIDLQSCAVALVLLALLPAFHTWYRRVLSAGRVEQRL